MDMISDELLATFMGINLTVISSILGFAGVVFNSIIIVVFVSLGFSDTTNITLFGLALADIGVMLTEIGYSVTCNPLTLQFTPFETIEAVNYVVLGTPHVLFCRIAGCLTAFITFERFMCVAFPLHVKSIVTHKRTIWVVVGIYVSLVSLTLPQFLAYQIGPRFIWQSNLTVIGIVISPNIDQLEKFALVVPIVTQVASFVVVVASTLGLVRSLVSVAKWRSSTSSSAQSLQVSGRDKQLVKVVFLISVVFICCSLPTIVGNLVMLFVKDFNVKGRKKNLFLFFGVICFILDAINSTINIFIYLRMSSKFREKFCSIFQCRSEDKGKVRLK
ncbi:unnamed protein product [Lymnaea stagnalis]|uniref:G-protein coupled receptors family 1 profile domain-containing protein n=1 Tax=Lymnaea stagnalis TaxID=6523 RepID=A0AAV2HXG8_LYMST